MEKHELPFINHVCFKWGLPALPVRTAEPTGAETSRSPKKQRLGGDLHIPKIDLDSVAWEADSRRFLFIVDCKPLMEVAC